MPDNSPIAEHAASMHGVFCHTCQAPAWNDGMEHHRLLMPAMLHRSLAAATTESRTTQWRTPSITSPYISGCVRDVSTDVALSSILTGQEQRDMFTVGTQATIHHIPAVGITAALVTAVILFWANYRNPLLWQRMNRKTSFSCRQGVMTIRFNSGRLKVLSFYDCHQDFYI